MTPATWKCNLAAALARRSSATWTACCTLRYTISYRHWTGLDWTGLVAKYSTGKARKVDAMDS